MMNCLKSIISLMWLSAITSLAFTGCATMFKTETAENVSFSSKPEEANVYVDGELIGKTPIELKLEAKKTHLVKFQKEGYEIQTFTITNHVGGGWVILDILGGLFPVIIDAATGAWYTLEQHSVNAILEQQSEPTM